MKLRLFLLCVFCASVVVSLAAVGGSMIGSGVTPSAASRGINRDVYIAVRTDGRAGTGTADDPFDGSTAAKFDAKLATILTNSCTLHLGPGTFLSSGATGTAGDMFTVDKSYRIVGAGVGVTMVKLATNSIAGTRSNVCLFASWGNSGNVAYFELGHVTLDLDPANQSLIATNGEAEASAVKVFTVEGWLHDLNVMGVYGNPAEKFPVALNTRDTTGAGVDGRHVIERVTVTPHTGLVNDDMTVISVGDPHWGGITGKISGTIRDCTVIGNSKSVAFGGYSLDGVSFDRNRVTNCLYGIVVDSWTNSFVTVSGNHFSRVVYGIRNSAVTNSVVINNVFDAANGGPVVFDAPNTAATFFGNIYTGYTLANTDLYLPLLVDPASSLLTAFTNFFAANSNLLNAAIPAGGGITFETTQFGTGGGATNIKSGATVTNLTVAGWTQTATLTNTGNARVEGELAVLGATGVNGLLVSGSQVGLGALTLSGGLTNSALTASRAVFTDANKKLVSTGASADLAASLSDETGTGAAVFSSAPSLTNLLSFHQITYATNAVASAATVYLDFSTNIYQYAAITNDITFHSTNRTAAVRATVLRILGDTVDRALAFNTNWVFIGAAAPTTLSSNKTAILSLTLYGTNEADVVAAYAVQP